MFVGWPWRIISNGGYRLAAGINGWPASIWQYLGWQLMSAAKIMVASAINGLYQLFAAAKANSSAKKLIRRNLAGLLWRKA
jgi:hypothetical protein